MEAAHAIHLPKGHYPARIVSIKVRVGEEIKCDAPLIIYEFEQTETEVGACERDDGRVRTRRRRLELLSPYEGKVESINVTVGQEVDQAKSDFNGSHTSRATINMAHDVLGLTEAARLEQVTTKRLLASRKLSLIVDLDQTIIHATVDPTVGEWRNDRNNVNHEATRDIAQFILPDSPTVYYIKLRPNAREFLKAASERYELHIYTMGTRSYASKVAEVIDPDGTIFQERVLSRDESGSVTQKTLQRLFPCDTSMVVVIDDRADQESEDEEEGAFLFHLTMSGETGEILHHELWGDLEFGSSARFSELYKKRLGGKPVDYMDQLSLERQEQAHRRTMERQQKSRPLEKQQQRQGNQRRPVLIDNDDELSTVLDVLREVHRRFYEKGEA
ncbi:MAG: HAD-like domain-containing protein, partial [Olpidium bornovanus]